MCGIVGIYNFDRREPVKRDHLESMNSCIVHRGPDDAGIFLDGYIGLGMRRLAIIDLPSGRQPMSSDDGSIWIVFNGEIYNYQFLRQGLIAQGHQFKTSSDTEVILRLYEEEGLDCLQKLRGMFAFSIWDKKRQRLFVARDRLGKKPLVYSLQSGRFSWASEISALRALPWVSSDIDEEALDLFLGLQYVPSPRSIYKAIRKLPQAHYLLIENGQLSEVPYWDLPLDNHAENLSIEETEHRLREKLIESTKLRMIADVPLGAFLSGGIDSSIVVALMSQLSDKPVKTFSIGFESKEDSELPFAQKVANRYGTKHTEFIVKPNMTDVLPKLVKHYGEPFGDSSALPSYYLARETKKHVTVALNGDGGDENFAGYRRYAAMKSLATLDAVPLFVRKAMLSFASALPLGKSSLALKINRVLPALAMSTVEQYQSLVGIFSRSEKEKLYNESFKQRLKASLTTDYLENIWDKSKHLDFVNRLLYLDFRSYLPECLMVKIDIATMANSLESRSPLLDHEFVEMAFRIPGAWKIKGNSHLKWILKDTFKDLLPDAILHRSKMGFGLPLKSWFQKDLLPMWNEHVLGQDSLGKRYFNSHYLKHMRDEHISGRRNHGYRMWNVLMLELWAASHQ